MRNYEHAAQFLSEKIAEQGINAAELARRTGIDAGLLRALISGRNNTISTRNIFVLSRYFGMSMKEMIDLLA